MDRYLLKGYKRCEQEFFFIYMTKILSRRQYEEAVVQMCSVKKMFLEIRKIVRKIHRKTPVPETLF